MHFIQIFLAFFALSLPIVITAQCNACDSYTAALKSCQKTSANITEVGNTMDTTSIHCMCSTNSNAQQINACDGCWDSNPDVDLDITILLAWSTTCKADGQFGEQQAVACWEGQPGNFLPCLEKGTGTSGGPTSSGSGATTSAPNLGTR